MRNRPKIFLAKFSQFNDFFLIGLSIEHSGSAAMNKTYCPNTDDFFPCLCSYRSMHCGDIPLDSVRNLFKTKSAGLNKNEANHLLKNFELLIPPKDLVIPADLLSDKFAAEIITLHCQDDKGTQRLKVDPEAFRSSRNFILTVEIFLCDTGELDFLFLRGFQRLVKLDLSSDMNVHLLNWTSLPTLPNFRSLDISYSEGLNEWVDFPKLEKGLEAIQLPCNKISDLTMDRIMQWILSSPSADTLGHLNVGRNALTKIPSGLSSLKRLQIVRLYFNPITCIQTGMFNFSSVINIFLEGTQINAIEPEAFQGYLYNFSILYETNF